MINSSVIPHSGISCIGTKINSSCNVQSSSHSNDQEKDDVTKNSSNSNINNENNSIIKNNRIMDDSNNKGIDTQLDNISNCDNDSDDDNSSDQLNCKDNYFCDDENNKDYQEYDTKSFILGNINDNSLDINSLSRERLRVSAGDNLIKLNRPITPCDNLCESQTPNESWVMPCKIYPGKVYADLFGDESFGIYESEKFYDNEEEKCDVIKEEDAQCTDEEREEDVVRMPSFLPRRMHYLDSVVYMSPKRDSLGGRSSSLPTSASLVNLGDLARLQGLHDRAKGKNSAWGNRKSIGKSLFVRLTKRLTPSNDKNECREDCKNSVSDGETAEEENYKTNKKPSWKVVERRGSAFPGILEGKSKSFRMGQIFRWSSTSGSDNLLHQAIINKDVAMLEKLLAHNQYLEGINYLEPPGVTVFHQACGYGDYRVVQLLLEKGADVKLLTWTKLSPLKIAVMFGHYEIAELLLDSGADLQDVQNGFQDLHLN